MGAGLRRVAITGMSGITAFGQSWAEVEGKLHANASGIENMPEWSRYAELNTRLGGPVRDFTPPAHFTRKVTRSMGRVSLLATCATERALAQAGDIERASRADLEVIWAPPERYTLTEKGQAASQATGLSRRFLQEKIWQLTPQEIARNEAELEAERYLEPEEPEPVGAAG